MRDPGHKSTSWRILCDKTVASKNDVKGRKKKKNMKRKKKKYHGAQMTMVLYNTIHETEGMKRWKMKMQGIQGRFWRGEAVFGVGMYCTVQKAKPDQYQKDGILGRGIRK